MKISFIAPPVYVNIIMLMSKKVYKNLMDFQNKKLACTVSAGTIITPAS